MTRHFSVGRIISVAVLPCVVLAFNGCFTTAGLIGSPDRVLSEPTSAPVCKRYETAAANRTLTVPVAFERPDVDIRTTVMRDTLGMPVVVGQFKSGEILGREFGKVFAANFKRPEGDEKPVATLSVNLGIVSLRQNMLSGEVMCDMRVSIQLVRTAGDVGYSHEFRAKKNCSWTDTQNIPSAFYSAVESIVDRFLEDWNESTATATLLKWAGSAGTGVTPPELKAIDFAEPVDGVRKGTCTVACNGYEGFQAKAWANAQIAVACKTKLGIEAERVRVIYDREDFHESDKTWRFTFQTFARAEKTFSFDMVTRRGFVTGDLGLMGKSADAAAAELRAFALKEMDARAGAVTSVGNDAGKAQVRFDDFTTDSTYNLITIRFRLVY